MRTVLFICTGNTCRSPMAEAIARDAIDRGELPGVPDSSSIFVASAGTHASEGMAVSPETVRVLKEMGIEHHGSAKRLTAEMIRRADLVFAMAESHVIAARRLVPLEPHQQAKIVALDPVADIDDPIGHGADEYHRLGDRLRSLVPRRLLEELVAKYAS